MSRQKIEPRHGGKKESKAEAIPLSVIKGPLKLAFFALAGLVLVIHLWDLGHTPAGAYVDEISIGYNALSILHTGTDEHGVSFPLFFRAFGEYKNPIFIYSLVPLVKIFGAQVWVLRLAAALFGLGTALFIALIVLETFENLSWAMFAFTLTGILPWLFTLSRISFEVISFPFLMALGWWSWLRASRSNSSFWYLLSSVAWGMSLFSYSTARLVTPVLVFSLILCYFRDFKLQPSRILPACIPFALCATLLAGWALRNPGGLTARFNALSIWRDNPSLPVMGLRFFSNYLDYFSPSFLFLKGDLSLRHHTGLGGELFLFTFPALLAGLCYAWERRKEPLFQFSMIGFLVFPLAASLTADKYHSLRTLNALPFIALLIVCGFYHLRHLFRAQRTLVALFTIMAIFETGRFYYDYFSSYPARAHAWFNAGLPEAVQAALAHKRTSLYYSASVFRDENKFVNQPDIYFLFFGQLDPAIYRKSTLTAFDIHPLQSGAKPQSGSVLLFRDTEEFLTPSFMPVLFSGSDSLPPNSDLIEEIRVPSNGESLGTGAGRAVFHIYRIP